MSYILNVFANRLDPDQARQNLNLIWIQFVGNSDDSFKDFFANWKNSEDKKACKIMQLAKI